MNGNFVNECLDCDGTGYVEPRPHNSAYQKYPCKQCGGTGRRENYQKVEDPVEKIQLHPDTVFVEVVRALNAAYPNDRGAYLVKVMERWKRALEFTARSIEDTFDEPSSQEVRDRLDLCRKAAEGALHTEAYRV